MNSDMASPDILESCTGGDSRLEHLKCAMQRIVDANGDIEIGFARFHQVSTSGSCNCGYDGSCVGSGANPGNINTLVPIKEDSALDVREWNDFSCGACSGTAGSDPELFAEGPTPIAGSLAGAQVYFQGNDPTWMGMTGGDPIRDDPFKDVFLPSGEQCRPYIVIMLTDGGETCGGTPTTQATNLLTTTVDGDDYRIRTIPISFGPSATCPQAVTENLAHAGGATDVPGVCEGHYARNEDELAVAVSAIIADSLKFETCNNLDDDCDILVDEDFPDKGNACNDGLLGICNGTGTLQCTLDGSGTECVIDTPGQPSGTETCNNMDDDCDGKIDEFLSCGGCQQGEICDNMDNDCDGNIDENLTRVCGTDVGQCTSGMETCNLGNWEMCTATGPFVETCDNVDNDCDGVVDGFAQTCETPPDPITGDPNEGICQPGTQVCVDGMFGTCLGEVNPQAQDLCDGEDNDCDGNIDEDHTPADCSSACGMGTTICDMGVIMCQGSGMSEPETCDGVDNDCDMLIDEGQPDMGPCDEGGTLCVPGELKCVGGSYMCIGGSPPGVEICDCSDNNCNGEIDEGAVCGAGQACVDCSCANPCGSGEFPCPIGQLCEGGFCLTDQCFGVTCGLDMNGDHQTCDDGACVRTCDSVTCPVGFLCKGEDGECHPDNCIGFPDRCSEEQRCVAGTCEADPCFNVTCSGENQYCVEGECVGSCTDVECETDERCVQGVCEAHPCGGDCPGDQFCDESDGMCKDSLCTNAPCPEGLACNPANGVCEPDPCFNVDCPNPGEVCTNGTCDTPDQPGDVDGGGNSSFVSAAGGGGCKSCNSGGGGNGSSMLLMLLVGYLALRRKKSQGEAA